MFEKHKLGCHALGASILMPEDFCGDASFDMEEHILKDFGRSIGRAEEAAFISGDGVDAPHVFLKDAVTSHSTSDITYDDVIRLFFSLDKEYRRNAVWIMNNEIALKLRSLKDADGNYLWNHTDNTIMGKPVYISNYMPGEAAGAKPIAFGDFSYYWIIDRMPFTMRRLNELFITKGQICYLGYEYLDAKLIMTANNTVVIVPEQAEVVRWIYDMYISGCGCLAIAKALNEAGIPNGKGNPWRPNVILKLISNEKYMGDAMMGKSVQIDGIKRDNLDGRYGERYYIENAHEGIVSKETFYRTQAIQQVRANPKLVKQEHPSSPFTGMIVCGCCGSTYRHKVNNSGKKWHNDIWVCARQDRPGCDQCNSTRIKDTILQQKFIKAYNEFV